MDRNELPLDPRDLGVPSSASKMISEPMVPLAQIVHLSLTDTNTSSKWSETRFHITHVTYEFHWVCPKWFSCLCYVWCNPCTYIASRLALSPNRPKWTSTGASSPSSTIGCVHNDFWAYVTFGANCAQIFHQHEHYLQMDRYEILHDPHHLGVPSGASKKISELMVQSGQTMHLSCIKVSTISKQTKMSIH
jgi:hypothetical protein